MKIDIMTKNKDIKTAVPALRFPEFRNAEEWEITSIMEICEIIGGGTPSSSNATYWNGDIPWISSSDINENNISEITPSRYITKDAIKNSATKLCKAPSIHIVSRVGVGKVAFSKVDICTSQDFTNLCNINCNYIFLSYLLSIIMKQKVQQTQGTSIKGIASAEIKKFHVPLPKIEEQQRIAGCLGNFDDLISTVTEKIEALKEYKKGLMQQLFPDEDKTTPAFRFPEFQNAGEWKETILESLCNSIASGKNKNNPNGDYDLYGSTGIIGKTDFGDYNGTYILVARVGAHAGFLTKVDGKFGVTDNTLVINLKLCVVVDFVYYLLNNLGLNNLVFGSGQPLITGSQLKNLEITIPSPIEQQKIADCLSSVDELISTETNKLDQLKAHKKGFMQQLFPTINE